MNATTVFVPGLRDHVAEHWQTHMAASIPGSVTVEPLTENRLSREARVAALEATLAGIEGDIYLVAHSAGVLTTAFWDQIADAADPRRPAGHAGRRRDVPCPPAIPSSRRSKPMAGCRCRAVPLSFPSIVVASRNDPLAAFDKVADLAQCWGARLHDAGDVGHLNPAAGFGPWPEGYLLWVEMIEHHPPRGSVQAGSRRTGDRVSGRTDLSTRQRDVADAPSARGSACRLPGRAANQLLAGNDRGRRGRSYPAASLRVCAVGQSRRRDAGSRQKE